MVASFIIIHTMLPPISTHTHSSHSWEGGGSSVTVHCVLFKSSLCLIGIWVPRVQEIHRKSCLGQAQICHLLSLAVLAPAFFLKKLFC